MTDQEIVAEITQLGFSPPEAQEILNTFTKQGGLACLRRWGSQFSFFHNKRNVLDILFKAGRVL